jgi:hypothetical protein
LEQDTLHRRSNNDIRLYILVSVLVRSFAQPHPRRTTTLRVGESTRRRSTKRFGFRACLTGSAHKTSSAGLTCRGFCRLDCSFLCWFPKRYATNFVVSLSRLCTLSSPSFHSLLTLFSLSLHATGSCPLIPKRGAELSAATRPLFS